MHELIYLLETGKSF